MILSDDYLLANHNNQQDLKQLSPRSLKLEAKHLERIQDLEKTINDLNLRVQIEIEKRVISEKHLSEERERYIQKIELMSLHISDSTVLEISKLKSINNHLAEENKLLKDHLSKLKDGFHGENKAVSLPQEFGEVKQQTVTVASEKFDVIGELERSIKLENPEHTDIKVHSNADEYLETNKSTTQHIDFSKRDDNHVQTSNAQNSVNDFEINTEKNIVEKPLIKTEVKSQQPIAQDKQHSEQSDLIKAESPKIETHFSPNKEAVKIPPKKPAIKNEQTSMLPRPIPLKLIQQNAPKPVAPVAAAKVNKKAMVNIFDDDEIESDIFQKF